MSAKGEGRSVAITIEIKNGGAVEQLPLVGLHPRQVKALMDIVECETEVQQAIIWAVLEPEGSQPSPVSTQVFKAAKAKLAQLETAWLVLSQMLPGGEYNDTL